MLCGDVEPNPGPPMEEMLNQLLSGQKEIQKRLDAMELKLKNVEALASNVKELSSKVSGLEKTVRILENKLVDLEDRSRRNNVLVFGIAEKPGETTDDLKQSVVEGVFKTMMGVQVSSTERIHRVGRKQSARPRPVVLRLMDYREKDLIFKNCFKLKGNTISVSEDFSAVTRQKRKKLWDSAAEIRKAGGKVRLTYDKIKINDVLYQWDDAQKRMTAVGNRDDNENSNQ